MVIQQAAYFNGLYCTFVGGLQLLCFYWQIYRQNFLRNEKRPIYIVKESEKILNNQKAEKNSLFLLCKKCK